jgi:hypothetical protein
MPFRLLHTADLHLDAAFTGIGVTPPWVRHRLATAGLDTLDRIVDAAIEREVDAVFVAGGLWTGFTPTLSARRQVRTALERLAAHGVQAVVTGTERDRLDLVLADWQPPPSIGVVPAGELRAGDLGRGNAVMAHVLVGSGMAAMAALAQQPAEGDGLPMIGVCALPPAGAGGNVLPPLERSPVAYWALGGRWPARADRLPRGAWAVMVGTPQLHRFPEPGTGAGVVVIDGPPEAAAEADVQMNTPSWVPTSAVELITVPVPLSGLRQPHELADRLRQLARRAATALPGQLPVLRAIAEGTGPLRSRLVDPEVRARVLAGARDRDEQWWFADLVLAPRPRQDPAQRPSGGRTAPVGAAAAELRAMPPDAGIAATWKDVVTRPVAAVPPLPAWTGLTTEASALALDILDGLDPTEERSQHEVVREASACG